MGTPHWIFMDDNDPKHRSKICIDFLAEQHITHIRPSPKSPDILPIENVWSMMITAVYKLKPRTLADLKKAMKKAWRDLDQKKIDNCILPMPTRMQMVIAAKGQHIKY